LQAEAALSPSVANNHHPQPDRYGFYSDTPGNSVASPSSTLASGATSSSRSRSEAVEIIRRREKKWLDMLNNWAKVIAKDYQLVRERCRKGIPDSVRPKVWFHLCGAFYINRDDPDLYRKCMTKVPNERTADEIERDLERQFPHHELFMQPDGHGQQALRRVLRAYAGAFPDVGYCQAMAPLAGALLLHMPESDTFYTVYILFDKYMRGYFRPGLDAVQVDGQILYGLLKRLNQPIYKHLVKYKVEPLHFMVDWFMCLYVRTLPWPTLLRVWDVYFCEGVKIVFRVAIALVTAVLGSSAQRRRLRSFEDTLDSLRRLPASATQAAVLLPAALKLQLSAADFEREHQKQFRLFNLRKLARQQQVQEQQEAAV
uniref:Rab-GAP TBC domain-containing protein n=3 Tax=Macrostomum lignano TaxID=282301 RepID=A0A1I8GDF9_9PLAT